jgi:glycosyltransferase involved in cell wall biosynthesis
LNDAAAQGDDAPRDLLSVLVPVYNEQEVLRSFYDALRQSVDPLDMDCEILFVNDGSDDSTSVLIHELHRSDPDVAILDLSRNFGKEIALTAGLRLVSGDAVVVLDADLQDPPELIPELVAQWREGYDMVLARRRKRRGDPWIKRTTAGLFYRLMRHIGDVELPQDVGDFRLLSRRAISAINSFEEHNRFMKGLFAWIGFKQTTVYYERAARRAGETKWNFGRLWKLALEGITSFTTAPLRVSTYIGLTTALGSFAYGLFIVVRTLLFGDPVPGYPSLITIVLFLGGIQLMSIGIMGEYIGRIFTETKRRPLYLIDRHLPARSSTNRANRS